MNPRLSDTIMKAIAAALAAGCLLGLVHAVSVIGLKVSIDPNEGWNAYFAQLAMAKGSPYPVAGRFLVNNYPPLSFYLVGAFGRLLGDDIVAGRIVSLVALLALAAGIGKAALQMGCDRVQAAFAALLFVAGLLLTSDYGGMNDPQLLAHAVAICGLLVALRTPRTPRDMVVSALLLALAFFVKHNLVLLPAALAFWLLLIDRRNAVTFAVSGAVFALIGMGVFKVAYGTSFLAQIASARVYDFEMLSTVAAPWLAWAGVPLLGTLLLIRIARHEPFAVFAAIYAGVATIGGLLLLGGSGVDANALFDADIALALCTGLVLERLQNSAASALAMALFALPLLFCLRQVDGDWTGADYWLRPLAEERSVAAAEISLLRASPGAVVCELPSLCYWAGKPFEVDVFNTGQRLRTGAESAQPLIQRIRTHRFAVIELEEMRPFPFPPAVEQAILSNYRIIRSDDERVFLAPRQGSDSI